MSEVTIRPMADSDVPEMARLRRLWTQEQVGPVDDPDYEMRFADWIARTAPDRRAWVAQSDGEMVGMVNMAVFERMPTPGRHVSRWGYLANAFVVTEHRNSGVGKLLMQAVLEHARTHGFARIVLHPSKRAIPFYERAGFGPADMLMAQVL